MKMSLPYMNRLYANTACTFGNKRYKSRLDSIQLHRTKVDTLIVRLKPQKPKPERSVATDHAISITAGQQRIIT